MAAIRTGGLPPNTPPTITDYSQPNNRVMANDPVTLYMVAQDAESPTLTFSFLLLRVAP
jgi:hypothetical protein